MQVKTADSLEQVRPPGRPPPSRACRRTTTRRTSGWGMTWPGFLQAVREHEKMHSDLMQQALSGCDPAKDLEHAYGKDKGKLRDDADKRIQDAAKRISDKTKDPLLESWHGNLGRAAGRHVPVEVLHGVRGGQEIPRLPGDSALVRDFKLQTWPYCSKCWRQVDKDDSTRLQQSAI